MHTVLKPGSEQDYVAVHQRIPQDLVTALRDSGVREWSIWRDGVHLFHLVDVDEYRTMRRALADLEVNQEWQATVAPFMDVADSYEGNDHGIEHVWDLSSQ